MESPDDNIRQGVCVGLSQVISFIKKNLIINYSNVLIPAIRRGLCDSLPEVRKSAAQAFDMIYKSMGNEVVNQILPDIIEKLQYEKNENLDGLKEILSLKSTVILPILLPKLLSPPITILNLRILASISEVSGSSLYQYLHMLIPNLLEVTCNPIEKESSEEIRKLITKIILSFHGEGKSELFLQLIKQLENEKQLNIRLEIINFIDIYCSNTKINLDSEIPLLIQTLLLHFIDENKEIQEVCWKTLNSVVNLIKKENLATYIPLIQNILGKLKEELQKKNLKNNNNNIIIPGFCLPKGIGPILPIFLHGLMYGSPEIRENAASGLGDLINLTEENALKPFIIQITGKKFFL